MAERRMFSKTIVDSDMFLDMPLSTQALYFHLGIRADDEGFVNNPKKIQRSIGCQIDDLKLLIAKNFIKEFNSGIIVITHWKMHNYIQKDRFKPTIYQEEKNQLEVLNNNMYMLKNECIQIGNNLDTHTVKEVNTQVSKGKKSIVEDKIKKESKNDSYDSILSQIENNKLKKSYYQYIKMRYMTKTPLTNDGLRILIEKLNSLVKDLNDSDDKIKIAILNKSVLNNYKDVYPLNEEELSFLKNDNNLENDIKKEKTKDEIYQDWLEVQGYELKDLKEIFVNIYTQEFKDRFNEDIEEYHKKMTQTR